MTEPAASVMALLGEPGPKTLGRYRLRYRVASGGMGEVFLAQLSTAHGFHKWVAVKTVHQHIARDPRFVRMFLNEARIAARIDHPNVCTVFDFGESDGTYYLAMEYLHGESLNRVLRRAWETGGFPLHVAARIVADAARGLHAAHTLTGEDGKPADVVHRDISPQNVFVLFNGTTKVVDFGIARSNDQLAEKTQTGELKGKLGYMSPEQIESERPVDRRTDLWALGAVLWEMTLGRRLFRRESDVKTIVAVQKDPIPRPSRVRPDYPAPLEEIVMRALERDLDRRYTTAAEMARDLEAFLAASGTPAGAEDVAQFVRTQCSEALRFRESLLRKEEGGSDVVAVDFNTSDVGSASVGGPAPISRVVDSQPFARRHSRKLGVGGGALMVAGLGLAFALGRSSRPDAPAPTPAPAIASASAAGTPSASAPAAPPPSAPSAPAAAPTAATAPTAAPSAPAVAPSAPSAPSATAPSAPTAPATQGASRPAAPATSPRPASNAPGYLNLFALPSAHVFEGAVSLGFTPIGQRALRPGRHVLRLVPSDGSAERRLVVDIRPGETTGQTVRFR